MLAFAAAEGINDFVDYLIKHGADVNYNAVIPLRNAAYMQQYKTVKKLIAYGSNVKEAIDNLITQYAIDMLKQYEKEYKKSIKDNK
jgi:ankyrin repeat protein